MKIKLGQAIKYEQPTKYIVESDKYKDEYKTPVLTAGKSFILGYTNETTNIYENLPVIIFDDFTTDVKFVDFSFKVKSSAMKMLQVTSEDYNLKFFYYLIKFIDFKPSSHQRHWISKFAEFEFDIPERKKQDKIVAKLDKLCDILALKEKKLEKLDLLVKSQFIEMFGDVETPKYSVTTFGNICSVRQGLQIAISNRKKEPADNRLKYITIQYLHGGKSPEYIENPRESVICNENDILMTRTGNTGMVVTNVKGVFHNNFFLIDFNRDKFTKDYLVNYLNLPTIQAEILKRAGTSTIPDLNHGQFYQIRLIVPPIELQNQFADFVKHIDKLKYDDVLMEVA